MPYFLVKISQPRMDDMTFIVRAENERQAKWNAACHVNAEVCVITAERLKEAMKENSNCLKVTL